MASALVGRGSGEFVSLPMLSLLAGAADRLRLHRSILSEQRKQACAVSVLMDSSNELPAFVYRVKINATDVYCIIGFEICWWGGASFEATGPQNEKNTFA